MNLRVLVPFEIFAEADGVLRMVAESTGGSFGLLPRRLDCVAALVPGILMYETQAGGESYLAVDVGVLVKTGADVLVSVRRAVRGDDLGRLRQAVVRDFLKLAEEERGVRSVMARLESGFVHRFAALQHA